MIKRPNKWMVVSALSIIVIALLAFSALAMGKKVSNVPLPLNASSESEYKMQRTCQANRVDHTCLRLK